MDVYQIDNIYGQRFQIYFLLVFMIFVKTGALSLVNRMLETYRHAMEGSCADKAIITDFPSALSQVDLIHFITEAMNTSSENLFR